MIRNIEHLRQLIAPWFNGKQLAHETEDFIEWIKLSITDEEARIADLLVKASTTASVPVQPPQPVETMTGPEPVVDLIKDGDYGAGSDV